MECQIPHLTADQWWGKETTFCFYTQSIKHTLLHRYIIDEASDGQLNARSARGGAA